MCPSGFCVLLTSPINQENERFNFQIATKNPRAQKVFKGWVLEN